MAAKDWCVNVLRVRDDKVIKMQRAILFRIVIVTVRMIFVVTKTYLRLIKMMMQTADTPKKNQYTDECRKKYFKIISHPFRKDTKKQDKSHLNSFIPAKSRLIKN